jgi:hypothetical protein
VVYRLIPSYRIPGPDAQSYLTYNTSASISPTVFYCEKAKSPLKCCDLADTLQSVNITNVGKSTTYHSH